MSDESKAKAEALARRLATESISSLRANYGIVFDDAEDTEAISREFAPVLGVLKRIDKVLIACESGLEVER